MKTITHYVCEICETEYETEAECRKCEEFHKKPVSIVSAGYLPYTHPTNAYPTNLVVEMEDGVRRVYVSSYHNRGAVDE